MSGQRRWVPALLAAVLALMLPGGGEALPAGLSAGEDPVSDRFPLRLAPGDTVLMVSDGICGTGDDRWLREKLEGFDGASPKDLARELITQSPQGATDDRTALVIRLEKRRA